MNILFGVQGTLLGKGFTSRPESLFEAGYDELRLLPVI